MLSPAFLAVVRIKSVKPLLPTGGGDAAVSKVDMVSTLRHLMVQWGAVNDNSV